MITPLDRQEWGELVLRKVQEWTRRKAWKYLVTGGAMVPSGFLTLMSFGMMVPSLVQLTQCSKHV
jgi:hypothetical protein